jgi:hypothetical protein
MFWDASQDLSILGESTRTLNSTDHLIQVCAHGLTWVKNPPVRWAADVMKILDVGRDEIDWDRLVVVAKARGVTLHVAAPLEFLRKELDAPVPIEVINSLRRAPASRRDRRQHQNWMSNYRGRPASLLQRHWSMFLRGTAGEDPLKRLTIIPGYLKFWAQTDRLWKIPFVLSGKGVRVLGRRVGLYEYWDAS